MASHAGHRADIDGLRGLAILSVVLYHASASLMPGGYIGVDIFFVLSGYLITGILLKDLAAGQFSLRRFYARRIRRIYPALLTVLATCLIAGALLLLPSEYAMLGKHTGTSTLFTTNIVLWEEAGYFDTVSDFKPLLHLWSLAVEEQFYIVWPLLLWCAWRFRHVLLLLVGLFALSLLASIVLTPWKPSMSFYLPPSRFWELMAGGLLAYAELKHRFTEWSPQMRAALSTFGLLAIGVALVWFTKASPYPGWRAMFPVFGTVAILAAGKPAMLNRTLFASAPMVALGNISYPLYLWHWPLLAFVRILHGEEGTPLARGGAVALAVILAWLTTRYIERPIRFGSLRHSSRTIVVLFVGMLLVGAAGYCVKGGHGLTQWRGLNSQRLKDLSDSTGFKATKVACGIEHKADWCVKSREGAPDAVVYGDSHADHLFPGLADDTTHNWLLLGQSACPPLKDIKVTVEEADTCREKNEDALRIITGTPSIRTVALSALGPYYMGDTSFTPEHRGKMEAKYRKLESTHADEAGLSKAELYRAGLNRTISALEKAGKKVVLVVDIPELNFMPENCLERPLQLLPPKCSIIKEQFDARAQSYHAMIATLAKAHPNMRVFDGSAYFCDETECHAGTTEMLYYRDSHHLSLRGSRMLMGHFVVWLNGKEPPPKKGM